MRLRFTQEFEIMRGEIHDQKPAAGGHHARGLPQRARRIVEIMQHLMDHDEIEGPVFDGRRVNVALAQLGPRQPGLFEIGPRDRQHGVARIEPDHARRTGREKLQHPSRARAEIEQSADRTIADGGEHRLFDGLLRCMHRPQSVPVRSEPREIILRRFRTLLARGGEARPVGHDMRIGRVERIEQRMQQASGDGAVRQAEERPGALAMTLDEARFDEELEMARNARLRLAENVGEIGYRQLTLSKQRQDPQTRLLPGRPKGDQSIAQSQDGRIGHRIQASDLHIKICLYQIGTGRNLSIRLNPKPCPRLREASA